MDHIDEERRMRLGAQQFSLFSLRLKTQSPSPPTSPFLGLTWVRPTQVVVPEEWRENIRMWRSSLLLLSDLLRPHIEDCATVVRILTNRNNAQRQVLVKTFEELTQKDLSSAMKKALSGDVETLLLELLMPPLHYEAYRLQMAMAGVGTDEESLLEVLCTLTGPQLKEISEIYKEMYKKELEKELKGETSGDFAKLVVALLNKSDVTGLVYRDVETLVHTLNGNKCEAAPWIDILTSRDPEHLQQVLDEVEFQTGLFLDEALEKRFSGDLRLGLKVLVQCIQNPDLYLAKRLSAMKIPQTQRAMVSHCEEDLLCIRAAFFKLTGNSLYSTLQKHFKGDLLTALLNICRSED